MKHLWIAGDGIGVDAVANLATARWTNLVVEQDPAWSASSKDDDVAVVDDSSCTSLTDDSALSSLNAACSSTHSWKNAGLMASADAQCKPPVSLIRISTFLGASARAVASSTSPIPSTSAPPPPPALPLPPSPPQKPDPRDVNPSRAI